MKWTKINPEDDNSPNELEPNDKCFFAREYTPRTNYDHSETNNLICNLKKDIGNSNKPCWYYRNLAISKFAKEVIDGLNSPENDQNIILTPAPTSKKRDSDMYNDRLDKVLNEIKRMRPKIEVQFLLDLKEDTEESHRGGDRDIQAKIASYKICNNQVDSARIRWIIIIDDVITSGATFKAAQFVINKEFPNIEVIGIFWAKTTTPSIPRW